MAAAYELLRPDDLLHLRVEVVNLRLDNSAPGDPALVVESPDRPAYLIVVFPPQTIAEPAYFVAGGVQPATDGSLRPDDPSQATEPMDAPGRPETRSAAAQVGRPSRLVFKVPSAARIPYSLAGLLDWSKLELSVSPIAALGASPTPEEISGAPAIAPPAATETAIEMPYRLVISPTGDAAWRHRAEPFVSRGRAELWHTRLQLRTDVDLSRELTAPLRAIWSPDYHAPHTPAPGWYDPLGRTAMTADDRRQIVILTSAFHGYETDLQLTEVASAFPGGGFAAAAGAGRFARLAPLRLTVPYVPQPFEVEQLFLSSLGGWLRSRGSWDPPRESRPVVRRPIDVGELLARLRLPRLADGAAITERAPVRAAADAAPGLVDLLPAAVALPTGPRYQLDLSEWVHVATLGRDHYVRIVYEGELWPFRHRAALIKVTERKFVEHGDIVAAYLIQHMFIVVREPVKTFARDDRGAPLKEVRLTTQVTPDIDDPAKSGFAGAGPHTFWVRVPAGGAPTDFRFHAVGTDVHGSLVDFTLPMIFVSLTDVEASLPAVAAEYNATKNLGRRNLAVPGQKVHLAERDGSDPAKHNDNTRLVTQALNYVVDGAGAPAQLLKADVKIPQVDELLGTDAPTSIALYADYVKHGFDAGAGVFAQVVAADLSATTLGVTFSADKAGGFATPNLGVSTLSRALGPLAGQAKDAVADAFVPGSFFPEGTAMLFGTFDLFKLLRAVTLGQNAPKMQIKTADVPPDGKLVTATLDWQPALQPVDLGIAAFLPGTGAVFTVRGAIEKPVKVGGAPSGEVKSEFTGTLTDFEVSVLKSVFISFTKFAFTTRSGQKPDVTVTLDPTTPVRFDGDLKFVEELRKAIPPDLFGSGPSLDISPAGVRAGFDLTLPPLAVGVFALKDVSLGAALTLPFLDGKPVFDFNVSHRPHPFLLTVSLFGGGGFFHLQLDTAGMKSLEAALEFGAAAAIDIGVASGEVHIMAGIYFSLQRKEGSSELAATLTGYLRLGGSLSVLGLIHVSVEFNLSFTYDAAQDKAYGRATLTVQVEVAFFSKSVELTVERGFGGSSDPTFLDMFTRDTVWSEYALAYA